MYERKSVRKALYDIINDMQQNNLIEIFKSNIDNYLYIVPVWLRNSILKIHPSRIESDMVRNAIRSCGTLWQSINDLNEYPICLDNVKESLNLLGSGEDITLKAMLDIDERLKPLIISLKDNGLLGIDQETTNFTIRSETLNILKIIPDILRISGEADLWMEFVSGKPTYENMSIDLKSASNGIHYEIADRYESKDLKKFSEYK